MPPVSIRLAKAKRAVEQSRRQVADAIEATAANPKWLLVDVSMDLASGTTGSSRVDHYSIRL